MKEGLTGRFYLKLTINGNLIGEFSHNANNTIYTESCDRQDRSDPSKFKGNYYSSWQDGGESHFANLKIMPKKGSKDRIFELIWELKNDRFSGYGMLCDGILIGNYKRIDR